ncbi:MAG TPA: hypothetical protein VIW70_10575 [Rubrivivax sp.]
MRVGACVMAVLAGVAMSASAQQFVNLDFDEALLSEWNEWQGPTAWDIGAPGWGHSDGQYTHSLSSLPHLGFSQIYALMSGHSFFGPAGGSFALMMRSGTFYEREPRGDVVDAFLSQTGTVGAAVTSVSMLSSTHLFALALNGQGIRMQPVGLDPSSPSYAQDVATFVGEWKGDVSGFAGQVVELKIYDESGWIGGDSWEWSGVVVDEIRFLPVPEMSTASLFGPGLFAVLLAAKWSARGRRHRWPGQGR